MALRDRCKESDTLWKSWQAQYFVDVAKTLAGVCLSEDCVLRDRRRESAPWMLCFEVEGLDSWEGLHFWNLNLRISLRGQCSISYDLGSWFRGRRSTSETYFHFGGGLAQNARFGAPDLQFSGKRSFNLSLAQNARFGAPDSQFSGRSCLHKNARFGSPELQFSRKSPRICSSCRILTQVAQRILTQRSSHKDLAQVVPQDPDTLVQKDPDTEILQKWSYRILTQAVQKDPTIPQGSSYRDPGTETLHKRHYRILIQVVQKDEELETEILHKCA